MIAEDWTFKSNEVSKAFDKHVREQLPWYDLATDALVHVAKHYITKESNVYDIGAGTGNIGKALAELIRRRDAYLLSIDNSEEMGELWEGPGKLIINDILDVEIEDFSFAVCFLVLMFMSKTERAELLFRLTSKIEPGGAIIVFDKREPDGGFAGLVSSRMSLSMKLNSGVTPEDILTKELSLAGVQRPLSKHELPIDATEFFRFGDFSGWIIEG